MAYMFATFDVSAQLSGLAPVFPGSPLLKEVALMNMPRMVVTAPVSQLPMSWLKEVASRNMPSMFVTAAVFQLPMALLKAVALENMDRMLITAPVSQLERFGFNVVPEFLPLNSRDMSVTPVVQDLARLVASLFVTNVSKPALSRLVYFTPWTSPVSPTLALGHLMVSPSS